MNAPEKFYLPDIQGSADRRNIAIQQVGVKGIRYPIQIETPQGPQSSVAEIAMTVGLPADQKGTHMSRFLEILERNDHALSSTGLAKLLQDTLQHLEANTGRIVMRFPYFIKKRAPVSGVASLLDYEVTLVAGQTADNQQLALEVIVPVTSLCPCSKEISAYGAHNQRSSITLYVEPSEPIIIEELVRYAEDAASCELYGLLKRPDEKFVTERAYDNPKFVEDLVRDIALRLNDDERILAYRVESENFESIHNHSAYALIERDKR